MHPRACRSSGSASTARSASASERSARAPARTSRCSTRRATTLPPSTCSSATSARTHGAGLSRRDLPAQGPPADEPRPPHRGGGGRDPAPEAQGVAARVPAAGGARQADALRQLQSGQWLWLEVDRRHGYAAKKVHLYRLCRQRRAWARYFPAFPDLLLVGVGKRAPGAATTHPQAPARRCSPSGGTASASGEKTYWRDRPGQNLKAHGIFAHPPYRLPRGIAEQTKNLAAWRGPAPALFDWTHPYDIAVAARSAALGRASRRPSLMKGSSSR